MLLGLLLDDDAICLSCAYGLFPDELRRAVRLYDDDIDAQQQFCVRCGDMLVDYTGLLSDDDLDAMQGR